LVTNKHVIANATDGHFFFIKGANGKPLIGQRHDFYATDFQAAWHDHPNANVDIAVAPLGGVWKRMRDEGMQPFIKSIPSSVIPTAEQIADLDAVEDVMFVGYPNGLFDVKNLLPIVRRGITATPFQIDYEGEPKFLIDASVFPGSSGSPVFIANSGTYFDKRGTPIFSGGRFLFLGVISAVAIAEQHGRIDFAPIPTQRVPIVRMDRLLNLGIVYKSSTVLEAVLNALGTEGVL
jgi:V8-like Glu-specific endopeptidase